MENQKWWTPEQDAAAKKEARTNVLKAFTKAEKEKKPSLDEVFSDVYDTLPKHLQEQQEEMRRIIKKYSEHYPLSAYISK